MGKIGDGPKNVKSSARRASSSKQRRAALSVATGRSAGTQGVEGVEEPSDRSEKPFRFTDLPAEIVQQTIGMLGLKSPTQDAAVKALGRLQQVSHGMRSEVLAHPGAMAFYNAQKAASTYEEECIVPQNNYEIVKYISDRYHAFQEQHADHNVRRDGPLVIVADSLATIEQSHAKLIERLRAAKVFDLSGTLDSRQMRAVAPLLVPLLGELQGVTKLHLTGFLDVNAALEQLPAQTMGRLTRLVLTNYDTSDIEKLDLDAFNRHVQSAAEQCVQAGRSSLALRELKLANLGTERSAAGDSFNLEFLLAMRDLESLSLSIPNITQLGISWDAFEDDLVGKIRELPKLEKLELTGYVSQNLLTRVCDTFGGQLTELRLRPSGRFLGRNEETWFRSIPYIDLATLPKLRALELRGRLPGRDWLDRANFAHCAPLESLTLELEPLDGGLDFSNLPLTQLTELIELRATDVAPTPASYAALASLPRLTTLRLQSGKLPADSQETLEALAKLPALERLEFGPLFEVEDDQLAYIVATAGPLLERFVFPRSAFSERVEAALKERRQRGAPAPTYTLSSARWDFSEVELRGSLLPMRPYTAFELPETRAIVADLGIA